MTLSFWPRLRCRSLICCVTASRMLRSSSLPRLALRRAAALAEHPLEHLPRVDLHRHRRRRRPPRQRVHVDAAVVAVARSDEARLIFGRDFNRRERGVLADRHRRDLIRRDAGIRVHALRRLRPHPAQPRRRAQRVDRGRVGGAMAEARDDVHVVAERLERLEDGRELEVGAFLRRRPAVHDRAVRQVDEAEPRRRIRRRLREQRARRHHRVEQRQRERGSDALEERPAIKMLSGDEHASSRTQNPLLTSNFSLLTFFRNGVLRTMPRTIDEKR